ncbi:enoyl-CoA hydratase-related protein [Thermocrispum sp.]|jgi:enoyl-CoA hydratase/carnithine racemase|uniref:enoyl-CoA hydratase/isomerase family protein n=1 Tax=Thermocrispum sp. TaxID=2060768 RepID=UPI00257F1076|nr:enoyl-CoA hydratase-related protein [Thermocrispum sp.]
MTIADLDFQTLRLSEPAANVALLTLNRPDRFNAMTPRMFTELEQAATVLNDDDALRVLVITGAGKAFCSGYDLAEADKLPELGAIGMLDLQERAARAMLAVRNVRVPVIAAVNGPAAGGGLALALQADIRIAAPEATFVPAMVRVGLSIGDLGVSWLLPRLIGPARASEIAFTGRDVDAAEAERIGLVNALSRPGELMNDVLALAEKIINNSPGGVQLTKRAIHANLEVGSYAAALELENRGQALLTRTKDMPEALAAFRERRRPVFRGE